MQVIWVSNDFDSFQSILMIKLSSERDMGLGRNSTRIASRKKTTNYEYESESEEESDWNERKSKKKLSNGRNNGKNSKKYT